MTNLVIYLSKIINMHMNSLVIPLALSVGHIVVVVLVLLLLFGGKKIPELMRGMGSGIKEFKNAVKEEKDNKSSEKEEIEN